MTGSVALAIDSRSGYKAAVVSASGPHPDPTPSRVLVIHNPASGRGRGVRVAAELTEALRANGVRVDSLATDVEAASYAGVPVEDYDGLAVVGGDGTLHGTINELARASCPVLFAGTGTVNVIGREYRLPSDAAALARLSREGRVARIPLLECGDRTGVLFAEAGFLARVVNRVNRTRARGGRHGKSEFLWAGLRTLLASWGRPLVARGRTEGGEAFELACSNALATKARLYGGTMPMPLDPATDHPLEEPAFQLVLLRTRTPVGHAFLLALANLRLLPALRPWLERLGLLASLRVSEATLEGPPDTDVHVDAETDFPRSPAAAGRSPGRGRLRLPLEVRTSSRALELFVPR